MTKEERHLWYDFLKEYGVHFYRQKPIGSYGVFDLIRHAGRATFPRGEGREWSRGGMNIHIHTFLWKRLEWTKSL